MYFKKFILFVAVSVGLSTQLAFSEEPPLSPAALRTKVLNALRAKTEVNEMTVTLPGSNRPEKYKFSLSDLNPESLLLFEADKNQPVELSNLTRFGINPEILSYSFFNTENPKPFGFDKKFHITYTPVASKTGSLTHFLVYYDKINFYPLKVVYYNGSQKVTTIEYLDYKKFKSKVWRAQRIVSENHLSQKTTRIEFSKIEINPDLKIPPRLGKKDGSPTL